MGSTRRTRGDRETSIAEILDATEQLMVEEGYAAVTTRRVAARAGVKPPLVHYYFPTTDALLVASYRRAAQASLDRHAEAMRSERPLHAIWALSADAVRTALAIEFMALANHRKAIRDEIAHFAGAIRALQAEALARTLEGAEIEPELRHAAGLSVLLAAAARGLVMEEGVGIFGGHDEARTMVEYCLARIEGGGTPD